MRSIVRPIVAWLVMAGCIATPCGLAAERFTSAKATPLRRLKPGKDDGDAVRFGGSVQLAGQFFMVWKREGDKPVYRQVTFYPDAGSAARLPHPADEPPVTEVEFTNRDQAAAMLRELVTDEKPLPRGETGSAGAAMVTIRNYQTAVACDHRWYLAELVSASRKEIVIAAHAARPAC